MELVGSIAYLGIFAMVAWFRPVWAAALVVATAPLYLVRFSIGPLPTTLLEGMILVVVTTVFIQRRTELRALQMVQWSWRSPAAWLGIMAVTLLTASVIGIVVAPDKVRALGVWRAYFFEPALLAVALLLTLRTARDVRLSITLAAHVAVGIAAIAIVQSLTGWWIPETWLVERRAVGVFDYPNAVGLFVAPIMPLAVVLGLWLQRHESGWRQGVVRARLVGLLVICMAGIWAAKTEAALIALMISLSVIGVVWSGYLRTWVWRVWLAGLVALVAMPGVYAFVMEKVLLQDWSGVVRRIVWNESLTMLLDRPWFGVGLAGYQSVMAEYHQVKAIEIFLFPHNIVLNFWSELGVLGVVAMGGMLACIGMLLWSVWHGDRRVESGWWPALALGLFASQLTILIHGLVDVPYFKNDLAVQWWWLIVLTLVAYRASKK